MTFQDFVKKYLGKTKGYPTDSHFKGECLSIVKLFIKEVYGIDPPPSGTNSAYGYWSNFPYPLETKFKKVLNYKDTIPKEGWIVIWKPWDTNPYGHIALVAEGCTAKILKNYAQNWTSKVFQLESQGYNNVKGYLVPIEEDSMTDEQKRILDFIGNKTEGDVREAFGALADLPKLKTEIAELKKSLKEANAKVLELNENFKAVSDSITDLTEQNRIMASEIGQKNLKITELEKLLSHEQTTEPTANPEELEKDKSIFIKIWLLIKKLFK